MSRGSIFVSSASELLSGRGFTQPTTRRAFAAPPSTLNAGTAASESAAPRRNERRPNAVDERCDAECAMPTSAYRRYLVAPSERHITTILHRDVSCCTSATVTFGEH